MILQTIYDQLIYGNDTEKLGRDLYHIKGADFSIKVTFNKEGKVESMLLFHDIKEGEKMESKKDFRKYLIESAGEAIKSNNALIMCHVMGEISAYMSLTGEDDGLTYISKSLIAILSVLYS